MIRQSIAACLVVALSCLCLGAAVRAQAPAVVASDAASPEVQKDLEILALKAQLTEAYKLIGEQRAMYGTCQGQLAPYQYQQNQSALKAEQQALIEKFEKANPGFTLDPASGAKVKKPAPPPAK